VFYPAKPDQSERSEFLSAVGVRSDGNTWILKPSDGGKVVSLTSLDPDTMFIFYSILKLYVNI
jgi:hypothetical protein